MSSISSALVVGGGICGPVTASALCRAGIDAQVVEAYPRAADGQGGSLAIAANGLAALDVLGAGDSVRRIGLPIAVTRMTLGGRDLGRIPSVAGVEPMRMVRRGALHRTLHDHAAAAGARITLGRRLVGVEEAADRVIARFDDGGEIEADVLIGADGVRSTVRRLIDPAAPEAAYTGLLSVEGSAVADLGSFEGMTFAFGRRAYYLYWPESDGRVGWGANLPSATYLGLKDARAISASDWIERLRSTYAGDDPGERLVQLATAESLDPTGAIHIMPPVPHWYRGRMVLAGDAVHAPSNSTGQGASLAIESGIELARCLRDAASVPEAFEAYVRLRRDRVEAIARRGARVNSTKAPGPVARGMMRAMVPIAFRLMNPERTLGPELRHRIDWGSRAA